MTKPRIHLLALGGTIATQPGEHGMKHGLDGDDLVRMVPGLDAVADVQARTVARTGSSNLTLDAVYALAAHIEAMVQQGACDGVVVTQGTDTLEETAFLLDLLLDVDIPVVMTAAMRNPGLASADGPGNVLAAVRVAATSWATARRVGVLVAMLDHAHAALEVTKTQTSRLDAFHSPSAGPVATLAETRVVPLMQPVRDWKAVVSAIVGASPASRFAGAAPVALLWLGLGEHGALLDALLHASRHLGYGGVVVGAMGGGHVPEPMVAHLVALAAQLPVVVASRTGGGPLLRQTYEGSGSEIALRAAGLIFAGRLPPLKARLLLDLLLRAGADRAAIAAAFDSTG
ncbi:asparaginase [Vineibacter terrae]|uniref:asparaginase n=1 Tax=Vineibacter terrae TaxID=2586908 RepID=UPI002E35DA95|nr:asparaginase domain-containing protein [Vineibacter terrae]HEX2886891.1 asparaginase domain-containing protein [Vineibacter terrae]